MAESSDIHLYTAQTPNGIKISITLEELGLPYQFTAISFAKNEQKEPWFLEINPNGRIPALSDKHDGAPIHLFESGSIMQYLVQRYDKGHKLSYPAGSREAFEVANWLFFQNAGVGPMQGQANHFFRYAPEKIQYGIDRYQNETRRLYGVLETQLGKSASGFLVGDRLTIADIANWTWVSAAAWAGVDVEEFPNLKAWDAKLAQRPAFEKGRSVPTKLDLSSIVKDPKASEKFSQEASKWVMKGMSDDAKK